VTLALLTLPAFALVGWWLPGWFNNLTAYSGYVQHLVWVPGRFTPLVIAVAAAGVGLALLRRFPPADLYAVGVIGALLVLPQTGSYFLVLLLPVFLLAVVRARDLPRWRQMVILAVVALALLLSWVYQPLDLETRKIEALLMPLHAALAWGVSRNWGTGM
jgi:hypothetical protein